MAWGSTQGAEVLSPALRMLCEGWVTSVLFGTRLLAVGCLSSAPCAPASGCRQSPALFFLEGELSPGRPWESVLGRLQPASPSLRPAAGLFWGRSPQPPQRAESSRPSCVLHPSGPRRGLLPRAAPLGAPGQKFGDASPFWREYSS